ncbi:MAG: FAD-binding protein [Thermodesulfobacteriota bacterium]
MTKQTSETIDVDVLVVGGGLAGCFAAIRAREFCAKVALVEKAVVARSGSAVFCHDFLAPLPEGELDNWLRDIVEHTEFMSDQRYAEILLLEQRDRLNDLVSWGVPFERDEAGQLLLSVGRGHKRSRVVLGDCRKMLEIAKAVAVSKGVKLIERVMVTDLLTSDGHHPTKGKIMGAVGIHTRGGGFITFKARAVILCTGVIGTKIHGAYADNLTGDGQAMAFRAGAELAGLEFNFGSSFFTPCRGKPALVGIWALQTLGAHIVNKQGERFMERYVPERGDRRATQGLIAQAMTKEIMEGRGPTYFDIRHFAPEKYSQLERILPIRMAAFRDAGLDLRKDLLDCRPVLTYIGTGGCGGIRINLFGETNIPGLLAAGVSAQFPGCAESLSGVKLAYSGVLGYRAGERAGEYARQADESRPDPDQLARVKEQVLSPLSRKDGPSPGQLYSRLSQLLARPNISFIKTETGIRKVLALAKEVEGEFGQVSARDTHQLVKANELRSLISLLPPVFTCSLERKESRLTHYRVEYPYRDDVEWLKWLVINQGDRGLEVTAVPLPLKENRIQLASRQRIPSPIQVSLPESG